MDKLEKTGTDFHSLCRDLIQTGLSLLISVL